MEPTNTTEENVPWSGNLIQNIESDTFELNWSIIQDLGFERGIIILDWDYGFYGACKAKKQMKKTNEKRHNIFNFLWS